MTEITLNDEEIARLEKKLSSEAEALDAEDASVIKALVDRAKASRAKQSTSAPGWLFKWTYRF